MTRHKIAALLLLSAFACDKSDSGKASSPDHTTGEKKQPVSTATEPEKSPQPPNGTAMAKKFIIVDGHVDLPYRLEGGRDENGKLSEDPSLATEEGDFDYPRAVEGGLNAPFMSIYVPARYQEQGGAKKVADGLIDMVEAIIGKSPDKFAAARSPADIRKNFEANKISLPMGIENGAAIEGDLANLEHFHERGVRYITLTHSKDNAICDSSYAETKTHKGLSELGKKVVAEMNRLGIMVDISHVSDDTFYQVLEITKVPVIASHSSARHFVPGFERNMSDDMIEALADNEGVIMINFGSGFISKESRESFGKRREHLKAFAAEHGLEWPDPKLKAEAEAYDAKHPKKYATIEDVADHIEHVVKLVGIDHVGLGSDFDGVGDSLPVGLKDVSDYPKLLDVLASRGMTEEQIEKLCGQNVLRVWQAVEDYAAAQKQSGAAR